MRPSLVSLVTLLAWTGCATEPASNPVKDAFAASQRETGLGDAVAFRFGTRRGSRPVVYRLPSLDPSGVRVESQPFDLREVVGLVADRDVVYVLSADDELAALDLATGRFRVVDSSVAAAAIGPTGTPFTVHDDGSVAAVGLKSVTPWPSGFDRVPSALYGAVRERLVAIVEGESGRQMLLAASGQPIVSQALPDGPLHLTAWGDAALVATDSGIVILEPADPDAARLLPITPAPADADFSASGHRIHVLRTDGTLAVYDRFSLEEIAEMPLGGAPQALRTDPWGRYLLLRRGQAVAAVDAVTFAVIDSSVGEWTAQVPAAAPDGTILMLRGDELVAWVPGGGDPVAAVSAPETSRWLVTAWEPEHQMETVVDEGEPEPTAPGQALFVQVSTTTNAEWAADLAANLRRAGMPASVLAPEEPTDPYRVVLGPYRTREEAEATGRQLRLPFWIFTRDSSLAQP